MNFSSFFIARPVATVLLSIGLLLAGVVAFRFLPVASLPSMDIPTLVVFASRPGADPETMANSIAAPLERHLSIIPGITEITSTSSTGATSIVLQFDLDRDINGAAHDVQAAINAATVDLPSDLPTRPYYRKFNPADAPILQIAMSSTSLSAAEIYDAADTILAQRLSQSPGVSQVQVNGAEKPAVRVQLDPVRLAAAGVSSQAVYTAIRSANVLEPLGGFQGPETTETIGINGQISQAKQYAPLVLKTAPSGAILRIGDVARVKNGTANTRLAAWDGKQPAILLTISKEAGANAIETTDAVLKLLPQLVRWLPPGIQVSVISDRTTTIRASVADVQYTLAITIVLVLGVVLIFMRRLVPTLAAAVTVPLSIAGTLAGMWFMGYAIDNFSLMAITVSVGFVVDDAIVMIENIVRHTDRGLSPMQAAIIGARQIGFTVMSISISLVAVFIPLIFMGGLLGRLFHEFAMTLTLAIGVSALVSLSLTPMICGRYMKPAAATHGWVWRAIDAVLLGIERFYAVTLGWALRHRAFMLLVTALTITLTVRMYGLVPKAFMPVQDIGILQGSTIADTDVSFKTMQDRQRQAVDVILGDPAVATVASSVGVTSGWNSLNRGNLTVSLKPLGKRGPQPSIAASDVIDRLRPKLTAVLGLQTTLFAAQDLRGGGRQGGAQFQYAVISQDLQDMRHWALALEDRLKATPGITDVTSDQDRAGPQVNVVIDRDAAARLGVSVSDIDNALNNAYSQRQMSTIYTQRNQYYVVLEVDPALQTDPSLLDHLYVGATSGTTTPGTGTSGTSTSGTGTSGAGTSGAGTSGTGTSGTGTSGAGTSGAGTSGIATSGTATSGTATSGTATSGTPTSGTQIPLSAFARFERGTSALAVRHQGQFPAATLSFNLAPGVALSAAETAVDDAARELRMPDTVHTEFAGNAKFLQQSLATIPLLVAAALVSIYIVLGVLYESLLHPLTIISTLPSAGLGALIALWITGTDLSIMADIGIILLMGIVKKNAIMMVDFALEQERQLGRSPEEAILAACLERFRPITMTTLAALLGALPLVFAFGTGAELRQPLGIAITGGLIVSQMLTLYTTPVVYLALERLAGRRHAIIRPAAAE